MYTYCRRLETALGPPWLTTLMQVPLADLRTLHISYDMQAGGWYVGG